MPIQPDNVYVLPENLFMTVKNGILKLRERLRSEVINKAVDIFFCSLADDFGQKAIGIILSGAGVDGLEGVTAIGKKGGYVLAQSPAGSQFSGMPMSVIERDHPNVIDEPAKLAEDVLQWIESHS